ncbi:ESX secretion-associated protein EspG [Amycolatopsis sp. 195334CR]|uniref:ESX secretion-associated protein EspG n=1 Tax=Amycolatopsis sp. 195334CR TaxID=2814588 RepID=UPI001A8D59E3|nr:ESX secretion-associated protein EspG [Amycolatopsis sp. 195334CR]MBN6039651.1 ESX secretion-associated protein EspG [Amycolatopsis sp. 195334CR]
MTAVAEPDTVHFGLVELDLLAAHAGVPVPFPLRVPSFGRLAGERDVLLATAGEALALRGLADDRGPVGVAAEVVTALREQRGTLDLVLAGETGTTAVAALVYRSSVLVFRQEPGDTRRLGVRRFADAALVAELLKLVPDLAAPVTMPITLPASAVTAVTGLPAEIGEQEMRELFRDHGADPAALDNLVGLLVPLTGRGQLGATRAGRRTGPELSWLDGPKGRVRVDPAADGWLSVNPLRRAAVRSALEELATIVRSPR